MQLKGVCAAIEAGKVEISVRLPLSSEYTPAI
jgi:hypothetical protein